MDSLGSEGDLKFDHWRFNRQRRSLSREGVAGTWEPVAIGSRAAEILALLLDQPGTLVSKDTILASVWPGVVVEQNNLTVQMAALRRILDEGRSGDSCIQTVAGRGYRFVGSVSEMDAPPVAAALDDPDAVDAPHRPGPTPRPPQKWTSVRWLALAMLGMFAAAMGTAWQGGWLAGTVPPPRLSIVVLPFVNVGADRSEDYLADAVTDDLTSALSRLPESLVIAHGSAQTYKGKIADMRQIRGELNVRYAVEGSVQKIDKVLRVNVRLVATDTATDHWADRFDESVTDLAAGQEAIAQRIAVALGIQVVDAEGGRVARERPDNPDSLDLILRARSIENQPTSLPRLDRARALYEQALLLDPSSVRAMTGLSRMIFAQRSVQGYWQSGDEPKRMMKLQAAAEAVAPADQEVMEDAARLLYVREKWPEMSLAVQRVIGMYPNSAFAYSYLARGRILAGHPDEAVPLLARTIELNPRDPQIFDRYRYMALAELLIGNYEESIVWQRRAQAAYPDAPAIIRGKAYRMIAGAYALNGRLDEAHTALVQSRRIWPFGTLRTLSASVDFESTHEYAAQYDRYVEGLRLAGERDHADEDADFGVPPKGTLRDDLYGFTPTTVPRVTTIRTDALLTFIRNANPIIIEAGRWKVKRSVPGAVILRGSGNGGYFSDVIQERLRHKIATLTGADFTRPIVAIGTNSERFDGPNLALRLVAMGYINVYWYRGGREAWEVRGLPESEIAEQSW